MLTSSSRISGIEVRTGQRRKIPVIVHRQSPASPAFNPNLLSPTLPRSKELPVICESALSPEGDKWAQELPSQNGQYWKKQVPIPSSVQFSCDKHMFIPCLQPGQSRTGEVRACTQSQRTPSPNEGVVGNDQDQPYCYGNLQNWD